MNLRRADAICRKMRLDHAAMHRVLDDMEKRGNQAGWLKRRILLWALHQLVGHWVGHPKFHRG